MRLLLVHGLRAPRHCMRVVTATKPTLGCPWAGIRTGSVPAVIGHTAGAGPAGCGGCAAEGKAGWAWGGGGGGDVGFRRAILVLVFFALGFLVIGFLLAFAHETCEDPGTFAANFARSKEQVLGAGVRG